MRHWIHVSKGHRDNLCPHDAASADAAGIALSVCYTLRLMMKAVIWYYPAASSLFLFSSKETPMPSTAGQSPQPVRKTQQEKTSFFWWIERQLSHTAKLGALTCKGAVRSRVSQVVRTPGDTPASALLILAEEALEEKELSLRLIFFFDSKGIFTLIPKFPIFFFKGHLKMA